MTLKRERDLTILLSEEQASHEAVRTAFGVWNDVLYTLADGAHTLRRLGEERQAEAMFIDAESMARRARLHLRNMTARCRRALEEQLPAVPDTGLMSSARSHMQGE